MKSRKLITILLAVALIATLSVAAFADENNLVFTVESSDSIVYTGDTVSVLVSISENTGFAHAKVNVAFDPALVEYVDSSIADSAFNNIVVSAANAKNGTVGVTVGTFSQLLDPGMYYEGTGLVAVLNFKVIADADALIDFDVNSLKGFVTYPDGTHNAADSSASVTIQGINEATHVHTEEEIPAIPANCMNDGYTAGTRCTICEKTVVEPTLIPAHCVDIQHVAAVDVNCHQNGVKEHWLCTLCGRVYFNEDLSDTAIHTVKDTVIVYDANNVEHIAAVEPGCHQNGTAEYWHCKECNAVFADAALTQLTNVKSLTVPYAAENVEHFEAVEPSCHEDGNYEYWHCTECDAVFADAALTQLSNMKNLTIPCGRENIVHVDAVEAGCHQNGNVEYWYCSVCYAVFTDEYLTEVSNFKNIVVPYNSENIEYVEALEPTCHQNGNVEYWHCTECDCIFTNAALTQISNMKNVVVPYTAEIVHVDGIAVGCHQNGAKEYWRCTECDMIFTDAALTQVSNLKSIVIPYNADNIEHVAAVEPGCHQNGSAEYWHCIECNAVFADAALTILSNVKNLTIPHTAEVEYVAGIEAGCHQNGMQEYWHCTECDAVFADAAMTILTNVKNLVIPFNAENIEYVEAVEAGCHQNGRAEYWHCIECKAVFADAALTILSNVKNLTIPHTAEVEYVAGIEAGCHQNGMQEYWHCTECDAVFADAAMTVLTNVKNLVIPFNAENIEHVEALEAGCHQNGNLEYWRCTKCDAVFADAALTILSNVKNLTVPYAAENIVHVAAKAPTETENGNVEYWMCSKCNVIFLDAALTKISNIKNVTLLATGNPKDGDVAIGLVVAVALVSAMSIVALPVAKKHF